MRADDQLPGRGDCGEDVGAYVLGALTDEEGRAFLAHLDGCSACRDEVAALAKVADTLALTAPQLTAPAGLKRRVLADVREEQAKAGVTAAPRKRRFEFGRFAHGRASLALGGALAVAAAVGVIVLASGGSGGVRTVQASVTPQSASVVLRVTGGRGELVVHHMPQPPRGKIYEIWLKRGSRAPVPTAALFGVAGNGSAAVGVPGDIHGVSEVLVTPEPRGGSSVPTHVPVVVARLS
jgi:anti-sigma factor RsiW